MILRLAKGSTQQVSLNQFQVKCAPTQYDMPTLKQPGEKMNAFEQFHSERVQNFLETATLNTISTLVKRHP